VALTLALFFLARSTNFGHTLHDSISSGFKYSFHPECLSLRGACVLSIHLRKAVFGLNYKSQHVNFLDLRLSVAGDSRHKIQSKNLFDLVINLNLLESGDEGIA